MLRSGKPDDVGMSTDRVALLRERGRQWVESGSTPALVMLVARRGTIVAHGAFGRYGPQPDARALDGGAIFPMMSVAKVFSATAIMMLVDDGLVGLNRPVQEYLPEFVGDGKGAVMVHHLLTHTSGLVDADVMKHQDANRGRVTIPPPEPNEHPQIHELTWLRWDAPLSKKPGEEMSYSGAGYSLLAEIVRRSSGKNVAQFMRDRVFGPLGMTSTDYKVTAEMRPRFVERAADIPDSFVEPSNVDLPGGSVGGFSTAMDMAIFCQMFLNGGSYGDLRILSAAAVHEMTRDQTPGVPYFFKEDYFRDASRGYGWDVKGEKKPRHHGSLDSPAAYTHQGAGGVSILVDPEYELVLIYLSVSLGVMSPDKYAPKWSMDLFTNMAIAAIADDGVY